jgi:hypothetical protein
MTAHERLLRQIATEIEISGEREFRHTMLGTLVQPRDVESDPDRPLLSALCRIVYLVYHVGDPVSAKVFLTGGLAVGGLHDYEDYDYTQRLHEANPGAGPQEPGWVVTAVREHDWVVSKEGLSLIATSAELTPSDPGLGAEVTLRFPPEFRYRSTGWYTVLGDAGRPARRELVRLYFCLAGPDSAPALLKPMVTELNDRGIRFGLKTVNDPSALVRRDTFLVFLEELQWHEHRELFSRIRTEHADLLRDDYPRFANRLEPGFSFAHEPLGEGIMSFGEHRSLLVSQGLLDAWENGERSVDERLAAITARFAEAGLDAAHPYHNPVVQPA